MYFELNFELILRWTKEKTKVEECQRKWERDWEGAGSAEGTTAWSENTASIIADKDLTSKRRVVLCFREEALKIGFKKYS